MSMNKEDVREALKQVIDPELFVNIVDLGLIYDIEVRNVGKVEEVNEGWKVKVLMTLTSPGCPLAGMIDFLAREAIVSLGGVEPHEIRLEITFDPPWNNDMMTDEVKAELGFD